MRVHRQPSFDLAAAAKRAIDAAGGGAKLARALDIRRSAVQAWKSTHIPVGQVLRVAQITGIPAAELRPDLAEMFASTGSAVEAT